MTVYFTEKFDIDETKKELKLGDIVEFKSDNPPIDNFSITLLKQKKLGQDDTELKVEFDFGDYSDVKKSETELEVTYSFTFDADQSKIKDFFSKCSIKTNSHAKVMLKIFCEDEGFYDEEVEQTFVFEFGAPLADAGKQATLENLRQTQSDYLHYYDKHRDLTQKSEKEAEQLSELQETYKKLKSEHERLSSRVDIYREQASRRLASFEQELSVYFQEILNNLDAIDETKHDKDDKTAYGWFVQDVAKIRKKLTAKRFKALEQYLEQYKDDLHGRLRWLFERVEQSKSEIRNAVFWGYDKNNAYTFDRSKSKLGMFVSQYETNQWRLDEDIADLKRGLKKGEIPTINSVLGKMGHGYLRFLKELSILQQSTSESGSDVRKNFPSEATSLDQNKVFTSKFINALERVYNVEPSYENGKINFPENTEYVIFVDDSFTNDPKIFEDSWRATKHYSYDLKEYIKEKYSGIYENDPDRSANWSYKEQKLMPHKIYGTSLEDFQKNVKISDGMGLMKEGKNVGCRDRFSVRAIFKDKETNEYRISNRLSFWHSSPAK